MYFFFFFFFVNDIVEFEEWLTAAIIRVGENSFVNYTIKYEKILLFITKDLNGPIVF